MGKKVTDSMSSNPRSVDADQSVANAAKMMKDADVGLAPIVEEDRLVGTVTDRDIAIRAVAAGKDPETTKVLEIATKEVVTIGPAQELEEALSLMAEHQVRRLPVVEDGRLVGVLAQADVAKDASPEETGRLVERISE